MAREWLPSPPIGEFSTSNIARRAVPERPSATGSSPEPVKAALAVSALRVLYSLYICACPRDAVQAAAGFSSARVFFGDAFRQRGVAVAARGKGKGERSEANPTRVALPGLPVQRFPVRLGIWEGTAPARHAWGFG